MKNGTIKQNKEGEWYIDYGLIASPPFKTKKLAEEAKERADNFCKTYENNVRSE